MATLELKSLKGNGTTTISFESRPKRKKKVELEVTVNFNSIVNNLKGSATDRGAYAFFGEDIYSEIEKLADAENHFAGSIIERARNGKFISDKQACVVAYYARKKGLIN